MTDEDMTKKTLFKLLIIGLYLFIIWIVIIINTFLFYDYSIEISIKKSMWFSLKIIFSIIIMYILGWILLRNKSPASEGREVVRGRFSKIRDIIISLLMSSLLLILFIRDMGTPHSGIRLAVVWLLNFFIFYLFLRLYNKLWCNVVEAPGKMLERVG